MGYPLTLLVVVGYPLTLLACVVGSGGVPFNALDLFLIYLFTAPDSLAGPGKRLPKDCKLALDSECPIPNDGEFLVWGEACNTCVGKWLPP